MAGKGGGIKARGAKPSPFGRGRTRREAPSGGEGLPSHRGAPHPLIRPLRGHLLPPGEGSRVLHRPDAPTGERRIPSSVRSVATFSLWEKDRAFCENPGVKFARSPASTS